ncbi:MAG TPA: chemotaxis protein CheA, partial [Anaerolineae bacterium]|nr:chemotaxis protein CheA [Anaerolineae bacterium]
MDAMIDMSQFKGLFIEEAKEHLQDLNQALLQLEKEPSDVEPLNEIFRLAHTIKGMAATMGYEDMARLAHAMEDLLDELRQGKLEVRAELFDLLFGCLDALEAMLEDIVAERESRIDVEGMVAKLEAYRAPAEPTAAPKEAAPAEVAPRPAPTLPQWVRINVRHLDSLMALVEELVINRSWLTRIQAQYDIPALKEALEQHGRILADLRDTVLNARMVPVAQIFDRFPRMVRDLLKREGKEAEFIIEGREIELDRTILEQISDPLVHLLRNAVDHGIETPEEREKAGKPRTGTIRLAAWRERDQVIIEVSDDGRGMDPKKIAEAAVARGLVASEEVGEMSDGEVLMLICHPQFSTTADVTRVSGRGVGMDVVRRTVEALRGSLEILSTPEVGSTFRLRLPLTLAIVKALLVRVGSETYAIPSSYVERAVAVEPRQIKPVQRHRVILLDEAIPVLRLGELLQVPGGGGDSRYVVVVGRDHQRVGLAVDSLLGQEEIVIKSLPGLLG